MALIERRKKRKGCKKFALFSLHYSTLAACEATRIRNLGLWLVNKKTIEKGLYKILSTMQRSCIIKLYNMLE